MERKGKQDFYRVKVENGKINISLFEKANPIPHTKYKGDLNSKETQKFIRDVLDWIPDKEVQDFLKSFLKDGEEYAKKYRESMKKDFGY